MPRLLFLLFIALGAFAYYKGIGFDQVRAWFSGNSVAAGWVAPQKVYRWKDAAGNLNYGTEPPAGVKAELVKNTVSVVPAAKIPPSTAPAAKASDPLEGKTVQQLATERAIANATK